jgi:hypothetical protein
MLKFTEARYRVRALNISEDGQTLGFECSTESRAQLPYPGQKKHSSQISNFITENTMNLK